MEKNNYPQKCPFYDHKNFKFLYCPKAGKGNPCDGNLGDCKLTTLVNISMKEEISNYLTLNNTQLKNLFEKYVQKINLKKS